MRPIKFRAWDKVGKEMVYDDSGFDVYEITLDGRINFSQNCPDGEFGTGFIENGKQIELMQFTGLHDKNGKEIYEGDIVKFEKWDTYTRPEYEGIFQEKVFWDEETCGFSLSGRWIMLNPKSSKKLEVIGDIYESPELLK